MLLTTTDFLRQRFNAAKALAKNAGSDVDPETSFLRVDGIPTAGNGTLLFDIAARNGASVVERKLSINDSFVVTGIGLYVATEITAKPGSDKLETYPVALGPSAVAYPEDWFGIYNGSIALKTGQTVNMEALPVRSLLHIPQTQPANTLSSTDVATSVGLVPQFDVNEHVLYLPEQLSFDGSLTPTITLSFPGNAAADYTALDPLNNSKLAMIFFGYLIKGVNILS